ncbi:MAG: sigma-70 family RNA polymerase sigma factor [Candidatus Marinimicrobia bacterium]|nr:sigma-70 family RNA polymerase sigma factor [Candidatus Neomarinimicrobiota bacterium]
MRNQIIESWVNQFTQDLYVRAVSKVSDPELAMDLVQDTFLAAVEKFSTFKGNSSPKTWLLSILNHKIIDHYRGKIKQPIYPGDQIVSDFFDENGDWLPEHQPMGWHENNENLLDNEAFLSVLTKCMDALPDLWKNCINLKYMLDKKSEEVCQELGITTSNYWQISHRAKLQLRACIEKNCLT